MRTPAHAIILSVLHYDCQRVCLVCDDNKRSSTYAVVMPKDVFVLFDDFWSSSE